MERELVYGPHEHERIGTVDYGAFRLSVGMRVRLRNGLVATVYVIHTHGGLQPPTITLETLDGYKRHISVWFGGKQSYLVDSITKEDVVEILDRVKLEDML